MILTWLPKAIEDRDKQLEYIALNNPVAAIEQGDKIASHVNQLVQHPALGRNGRVKGTRELVLSGTQFIAVYQINGEAIVILRLLHGSQQWPETRSNKK